MADDGISAVEQPRIGRVRLAQPVGVGVYQADLFAQGRPRLNSEAVLERCVLDRFCWVDTAHRWLRGGDELLATLAGSLAWTTAQRPMYGRIVAEPRLGASACPGTLGTPAVVGAAAKALSALYGEPLESVWVNYYRGGDDSVAWHSDTVSGKEANPTVAIVSLGGPRRLMLRPRFGRGSLSFTLASGDLLVMGGACQHRWEHSVPKVSFAPPRMSITFRRPARSGSRSRSAS